MEFENKLSGLTINSNMEIKSFCYNDSEYYESASHNISYQVKGKVYEEKLQSFLKFDCKFLDLESAKTYFDLIKTNYKNSLIKLYKNDFQEMRCYY